MFEGIAANLLVAKGQDGLIKPDAVDNEFLGRHITFLCNDCGVPYYVGRLDCKADYKIGNDHRICLACRAKKLQQPFAPCEKHGVGFMASKCHYCCFVGGWFDDSKHLCDKCYHLGKDRAPLECKSENKELKPKDYEFCYGLHPTNGSAVHDYGCLICNQDALYILKDF